MRGWNLKKKFSVALLVAVFIVSAMPFTVSVGFSRRGEGSSANEGYVLSNNPSYNPDVRDFLQTETLYVKVWSSEINPNYLVEAYCQVGGHRFELVYGGTLTPKYSYKGSFDLSILGPGSWSVYIRLKFRIWRWSWIYEAIDEITVLGDAPAPEFTITISGRVTDSSGIGISGVTVAANTSSYPPEPVNVPYGVNFHLWGVGQEPETRDAIVELAQSGSFWIRVDRCNSPPEDAWHIAFTDEMARLGVKELGILLDLLNEWLRTGFTLDEWKEQVAVTVDLAPNLPVWEIWNEPNLPEFQYGYQDGSPEHYMNMLREAYNIIKSVNPDAIVLAPSLFTGWGQTNIDWLQSVINLGMLDYCDAVSIHLYEDIATNKAILNKVKSRVGDKPIWVTECGMSASLGESAQNTYLQENFNPETGVPADVMIWYMLFGDPAADGTDYGLIRPDYTFRQSYYSFRSLLEQEAGSGDTYTTTTDQNGYYTLSLLPSVYTLTFSKKGYNATTLSNVDVTQGDLAEVDVTLYESSTNPTYQLTVNSVPSGISFTLDGAMETTPFIGRLSEGTYDVVMPTSVVTEDTDYRFVRWEDDSTDPLRTVSLMSNTTLTATYEESTTPAIIFEDDFDDNIIDTRLWDKLEAGASVTETNQRLEINSGGGGWTQSGLVSKDAYDLTSAVIMVDVSELDSLRQMQLQICLTKTTSSDPWAKSNWYAVYKDRVTSTWVVERRIGGVWSQLAAGGWAAPTGQLMVVVETGTIYFYENGNLRYSEPYGLSSYEGFIYVYHSTDYSSASTDAFDNFNTNLPILVEPT